MFATKKEMTATPKRSGNQADTSASTALSLPAVPALRKAQLKSEKEDLQTKKISQLVSAIQKADPEPGVELEEEEKMPEKALQGKFIVQREAASPVNNSNQTGMPDNLKTGIENLSGFDMGDVKVHYNSEKPAQLNALAYAQGTDIHVASGQEKHLPHEAWHVAQQKQGRVQATTQLKQGIPVNDDPGLEHEADVMGAKSMTGDFSIQAGLPS